MYTRSLDVTAAEEHGRRRGRRRRSSSLSLRQSSLASPLRNAGPQELFHWIGTTVYQKRKLLIQLNACVFISLNRFAQSVYKKNAIRCHGNASLISLVRHGDISVVRKKSIFDSTPTTKDSVVERLHFHSVTIPPIHQFLGFPWKQLTPFSHSFLPLPALLKSLRPSEKAYDKAWIETLLPS